MRRWILLLLPLVILCSSCSRPTSSSPIGSEPKQPSEHIGTVSTEESVSPSIGVLVDTVVSSAEAAVAYVEDEISAYPSFAVTERAGNALKALLEENAMTEWKEVEVDPSTIKPPFVCVTNPDVGTIIFLLDHLDADIVAVDAKENITAIVKNVGDNSINGTFNDRIRSWFSVNEISIENIVLDESPLIPAAEISGKIMELYCERMMSVSNINPYSVSDVEVFRTSIVAQANEKRFVFLAEYAVKPNNIEFSDWYSGQGAEPLSDPHEGWLLLCREVTASYDENSHSWNFSW